MSEELKPSQELTLWEEVTYSKICFNHDS